MVQRGGTTEDSVRRASPLAALAFVLLGCLPAAAEVPRSIIYANVGGERVQRAFERLHRALERAGVLSRHGAVLRHELVHEHEPDLLRTEMERIVASAPAAIVAPNDVIAAAARAATARTSIPVVFGTWENPVHAGLVESLARPGANLTGFTVFLPLDEKRLELLHEITPGLRRIGVVADYAWIRQPHVAAMLTNAEKRFGVAMELFTAESQSDLHLAVESERGRAVGAWYVPHTEVPFQQPDLVVDIFRRTGKPVIYARTLFVEKGGLVSYQSELDDVFEVWAKLLAQVLAGVPPSIIPVERPRHFELAVNLAAARELGLAIPRSVLRRADRFY